MPDIPNRDELEKAYARLVAKLLKTYGSSLLEVLGDPPDINNIPQDFWEEEAKRWVSALAPFGEKVYLEAARRLLEETPIGVDWSLVNQRAVEWARGYTFGLVRNLFNTDMRLLQQSIAAYFEQGLTMGDLVDKLMSAFGPVRSEMIAVTEVTRAASEGEQAVARELEAQGISMVPVWQTNNDELVCPECGPRHNQQIADGIYPPLHPRCRCWVNHELPKVEKNG